MTTESEPTEPSGISTMLEFVSFVKQEEGLSAHQSDLYTIGASLVGLVGSIRDRMDNHQPVEPTGICLGLVDLINWITKRMDETGAPPNGQQENLG